MTTTLRAVIYVRVSTEKQARQGVSLSAQEDTLRRWAADHDIDAVAIVRDPAVHGDVPFAQRKGARELVALLDNGTADAILAFALDRLGRDADDVQSVISRMLVRGVRIFTAEVGEIRRETFADRVILSLRAELAEEERKKIQARTLAAVTDLRLRRRAWVAPTSTPLTAQRVIDREGKYRLVEEPVLAGAARQAKAWQQEGQSLRAIAKRLTDMGIAPPVRTNAKGQVRVTSGAWHAEQVKRLIAQAEGFAEYRAPKTVKDKRGAGSQSLADALGISDVEEETPKRRRRSPARQPERATDSAASR